MAKILIGLPLGAGVCAEFFKSFLPAVNLLPEEGEIKMQYMKWGNVVKQRNTIVKDFLASDATHLFWMDSDMEFPENTLSRLLEHDLPIVGGLYSMKIGNHATTAFVRPNGKLQNLVPKVGDGLVEVEALGTGCMLTKREVYESFEWPWFWYEEDPPNSEEMMTEDSYFCKEAAKRGFKTYCDTSLLCGHIGTGKVSLGYDENGNLRGLLEMV